ncbi:MAG TPA: chromate efflux transporter [Ideonella sp.]|uniref:chromate efflux transporter n=1 Tax=Ideonella sp. TaxID=1929293 RepID=UPI002E33D048|nr:chromate efflux transporter [Ideonella sp.]HEX5685719.1 chromate efflux transporter [Ideonella sp.]
MSDIASNAEVTPLTEPTATPVSKGLLFADCALLGLTAWGGFMALLAQAQERFVKKRQWVTEKEFLELIALVTMLPGPQAVNAIATMGHRVAGWGGFAAALAGIVLPGFLIIVGLWYGYSFLVGYPKVLKAVTVGVLPPLAVILAQAAFNQAKKSTPGHKEKALAVAATALLLMIPYWAAPIYVLVFGAFVSTVAWPAPKQTAHEQGRRLKPLEMLLCFAPISLAVFQLVPALLPQTLVAQVGLAFSGLSTTLFGGGLVMVPLLEGYIVDHLHWLDHAGFSAGLAASQLTPGPILSIATFTGMQAAGLAGAVAATIGIYLPTALISVGVSGVADRLKSSRMFQHAMVGVRCAVVGLIAGAAISLLLKLPFKTIPWQAAALVGAAYFTVWRFKQPPYVSLPIGVLLAWLLM